MRASLRRERAAAIGAMANVKWIALQTPPVEYGLTNGFAREYDGEDGDDYGDDDGDDDDDVADADTAGVRMELHVMVHRE